MAHERALTDLMARALRVLAKAEGPQTPNQIAMAMGLRRDVPRRGSGAAGRGGWSGYMAPSQRIISSLNALRARELVRITPRSDGKSGTAYAITGLGRAAAREEGSDRER